MIASRHPLYATWIGMRQRCNDTRTHNYRYYGGRGIRVCADWDHFWTFVFDVGPKPAGHTLDRIDNNGPYAPGNVRWATQSTQARNSRGARFVTHAGETRSVGDWAKREGVTSSAISQRLSRLGRVTL